MRPNKITVSIARARELLSYDPLTGVLVWISKNKFSHIKIGNVAGYEKDGYIYIKVDGHAYMAHRIIWGIVTGSWPKNLIDHKDTDGTNNQWTNLREATYSQNGANSRSKRNLPKGVYTMASGRFCAIKVKNYRHNHLGSFDTPEEAHQAYLDAAVAAHGEFARSS